MTNLQENYLIHTKTDKMSFQTMSIINYLRRPRLPAEKFETRCEYYFGRGGIFMFLINLIFQYKLC